MGKLGKYEEQIINSDIINMGEISYDTHEYSVH